MDFTRIKESLISLDVLPLIDLTPPVTSVLVTICRESNGADPYFLLTKRTENVSTHKGQVSFPGGFPQREDKNLLFTALREAQEEVGIEPSRVEVLGMLEPVMTRLHTRIYPFVGIVNVPYDFKIEPGEVDRIIQLPLSDFRNRGIRPVTVEVQAFKIESVGISVDGELVWGATARMLEQLEAIFKQL